MVPTVDRTKDGGFKVFEEVEGNFDIGERTTTFQTRDEVDFYLKALSGGQEQVGNYLDRTVPQNEAEVRAFELGLSRVLGIRDVTLQEWTTAQETLRVLMADRDWNLTSDLGQLIRILRAGPR